MKFRDGVERDPEDEVLVLKTRKEVDKEAAKEEPMFNVYRELNQPDRMCFCRTKVKNLKIDEGFFNDKEEYVSYRVE